MSSLSTANLNGCSFASQAPFLSDFQPQDTQEPEYFDAKLLSLDQKSLRILQVVSAAEGIAAKEIGQKVNLSRYATLQRAKKMMKSGFLVSESVSSAKTGIKPALYFFLAPIVTKQAVKAAISQVQTNSLKSAADTEISNQNAVLPHEEVIQPLTTSPHCSSRKRCRDRASISTTNELTKALKDVVEGSEADSNLKPSSNYPKSPPDTITLILEALQDLMQEFVTLQRRSAYLEARVVQLEQSLEAREVRDRVNLDELIVNIRLNR